jgi:hypothetical protein
MTRLFLDSSFPIALETADDRYHETALAYWEALRGAPDE